MVLKILCGQNLTNYHEIQEEILLMLFHNRLWRSLMLYIPNEI